MTSPPDSSHSPDGQPLEGQVAIVTEAGRGIGRATALALASRGARVFVNDLGAALRLGAQGRWDGGISYLEKSRVGLFTPLEVRQDRTSETEWTIDVVVDAIQDFEPHAQRVV